MSSIQATRMKKGMLIKIGKDLFRVLELQHVTPGNLRGFVRAKFRNIRTRALVGPEAAVGRHGGARDPRREARCSISTRTATITTSWTPTRYEQIHMSAEVLGDAVNYIKPDSVIAVEFYGAEPVGIELPVTVDLKVTDTVPGIKGATASNQIKPATIETGLVVNVPPFINTGDVIRVSTESGEYLSRA